MPQIPLDCMAAMPSPARGGFPFAVRLPLLPGLLLFAPDTGASGSGSSERAAPLRVLIVEDSLDVAETLQHSVAAWGYRARFCTTGHEALALAPYFQPSVVLIDIGLPDIDGWQLARGLREQNPANTPVMIAITAFGEAADFERSQQAGISFHLVKPAFQTQLQQLLERLARDT
jgi:CheY-like chemotaxis protein